jgi:hypothetical protein
MTWQESLRQLDARLAKGEIGAAEYRKARDEILAEASSGSQASNRQSRENLWATAQAQAKAQAAKDEAANAAETTLVVKLNQPEEDETTQVVEATQIQQAVPHTQTTPPPPVAPTQPVGPGPTQPVGPGVRPTQYRPAPIQGQEVFAEAGSQRGGMLLRFLVPLVILAVVGAGVWFFAFRDGEEEPAADTPPASTEQQQQTPGIDDVAGRLPELPGKANANNGSMELDRARELKLFTPTYATLLADNGASEVAYRGSARRGAGYLLIASPIPPANGADGVAVLTSEHLQRAGFSPAKEVSPDDPPVITRTDNVFRTFITVYSSGDVWIQLNVSGPPTGNEQALRNEFQRILATLTERLPAD